MRRLPRVSIVLALLASQAAMVAASENTAEPGPPHETRLTIGELPPTTFALASAREGAIFDLEAERGERPILLLFFRGTW